MAICFGHHWWPSRELSGWRAAVDMEVDSGASRVKLQTSGENPSSSNTDQTRREERQLLAKGFFKKRRQVTSTSLVEGDCSKKEGGNMRGRRGWTVPLREEEETGREPGRSRAARLPGWQRRKMGKKRAGEGVSGWQRDTEPKPGGCGQNGVSELTISKEKKARPGVALAVGNNSTGSKGHPACTQPRPTRTKAIPPSGYALLPHLTSYLLPAYMLNHFSHD